MYTVRPRICGGPRRSPSARTRTLVRDPGPMSTSTSAPPRPDRSRATLASAGCRAVPPRARPPAGSDAVGRPGPGHYLPARRAIIPRVGDRELGGIDPADDAGHLVHHEHGGTVLDPLQRVAERVGQPDTAVDPAGQA